ncbi:Histone H1.5 [Larimichthys crocea]|uniref:Uncharacterized protein n=1 Tax=Larimichthys crocea TaxID=215358 RepID=A0ACD3QTK1_LARCR|nr:Histone H1.5 [Larimichthys crocea]
MHPRQTPQSRPHLRSPSSSSAWFLSASTKAACLWHELKQTLAAEGYDVSKNSKQVNMVTKRLVNNETLVRTRRHASLRLNNKVDTKQVKISSVKPPKPKADLKQSKTARKSPKGAGKSQRQARVTPKPKGNSPKPRGNSNQTERQVT